MEILTQRQAKVFDFIRDTILEEGYPPTLREIGAAIGIKSTNGVNDHLIALEKKGYIKRKDGKSRGMTLLVDTPENENTEIRAIPLVGQIAAGAPLLAFEDPDAESVEVPKDWLRGYGPKEVFALRVKGESMIEAGILDGDTVLIRRQDDARNGEIVAAMVDEEATLKRLQKGNGSVSLIPENSSMTPFVYAGSEASRVQILGIAIRLIRDF